MLDRHLLVVGVGDGTFGTKGAGIQQEGVFL